MIASIVKGLVTYMAKLVFTYVGLSADITPEPRLPTPPTDSLMLTAPPEMIAEMSPLKVQPPQAFTGDKVKSIHSYLQYLHSRAVHSNSVEKH